MKKAKTSPRNRSIRRRLAVLGLASALAGVFGGFGMRGLEQLADASGPEVTYCVYFGTTDGPGAYTCLGGGGYYYYSFQQGNSPCPDTQSVGGATYSLSGALDSTCPPPA